MSHYLRRRPVAYGGIALLLAWPVLVLGGELTLEDDIKNVRESLRKTGRSAPYIAAHAAKRLSAWQTAAEKGLAEAQWLLGRCYELGIGVKEDHTTAVKWIRKSADQKFALAQNNLALLYETGTGVEKSLATARALYLKAADQNEPTAQHNLGRLYAHGIGVDADVKEAIKWYSRAAEKDHIGTLHALGELYEFGNGVKEDAKEAAKWYRRASNLGDGWAAANLAILYQEGIGVNKDPDEAKRLRQQVEKRLGKDAEHVIRWSALRMVVGTWQLRAKVGDKRYVLTLTLSPDSKGQFYLFQPTKADDSQGALKVGGLSYKIERRPGAITLVLEQCLFLPDKTAKVAVTLEGSNLRFKDGTALWSKDGKVGLELTGTWSALETQEPYGRIEVGPGSGFDFASYAIKKDK